MGETEARGFVLCLLELESIFYVLSGGVLISHCVPTAEAIGAPQVSSILWGFFVENRAAIEGEILNE